MIEDLDFGYDAAGQLEDNDGSNIVYDENGNRTFVDATAVVSDSANRVTSDGTFDYDYDNEGNLIRRTEISTGQVRQFKWDYRNRLARVTDHNALGQG